MFSICFFNINQIWISVWNKNVIKQKQLEKLSPVEIRRYLLEKLELSYTINDIEKCLLKINK